MNTDSEVQVMYLQSHLVYSRCLVVFFLMLKEHTEHAFQLTEIKKENVKV